MTDDNDGDEIRHGFARRNDGKPRVEGGDSGYRDTWQKPETNFLKKKKNVTNATVSSPFKTRRSIGWPVYPRFIGPTRVPRSLHVHRDPPSCRRRNEMVCPSIRVYDGKQRAVKHFSTHLVGTGDRATRRRTCSFFDEIDQLFGGFLTRKTIGSLTKRACIFYIARGSVVHACTETLSECLVASAAPVSVRPTGRTKRRGKFFGQSPAWHVYHFRRCREWVKTYGCRICWKRHSGARKSVLSRKHKISPYSSTLLHPGPDLVINNK